MDGLAHLPSLRRLGIFQPQARRPWAGIEPALWHPQTTHMARILCLDDEPSAVMILEDHLQRAGHQTVGVHNVEAALSVLARGGIDLVISDYKMPGTTGLEFQARMEVEGFGLPLIMVTGYASIEHAVAAIKAGAADYITKPIEGERLVLAVEHALEMARLRSENAVLRAEVDHLMGGREIVGSSPAFLLSMETVNTVAPTRATILLQGESGTGKELLARALHERSDRSDGPFISVNCAALPENLIESTLFGHERGAFTGAVKRYKGAFERAHHGTLLLDEISEMRLDLQGKLLRVLQEREFERVGGTGPIEVDVRIVATTNRDLAAEVEAGRFREDLYYRLSVVPLQVPPLRERMEDIPALAEYFVGRTVAETGRRIDGIAPETFDMLQRYSWPGNIRELAHAVERAVILSSEPLLTPDAFDRRRFGLAPTEGADGPRAGDGANGGVVLRTLNLAEAEESLIGSALEATAQNRTKAADLLGISVRTLRSKLNRPS